MEIPFASDVIEYFYRRIDRANKHLDQRKQLARELVSTCESWTRILDQMFDRVRTVCREAGPAEAAELVMRQQRDYATLDYRSVRYDSPILAMLAEDDRFTRFVETVAAFYHGAIALKAMALTDLTGMPAKASERALSDAISAWRDRLEELLGVVRHEGNVISSLKDR